MKYNNLRAFEKHLADSAPSHFAGVYLIVSKEDFQRKQAIDLVVRQLSSSSSSQGFNVQSFETNEIKIDKVLTELHSFSFFSGTNILSLQNLDKAPKAFMEKLESALAAPKLSATLILAASSLPATTKLYKRVEKTGIILDIPEEKPWIKEKSQQEWTVSLAAKKGKTLSPQASLRLIKRIGTDSSDLFHELEKLVCYVGDRTEITEKDILEIGSVNHVETIWQLAEAIFKRDSSSALRISKGLLENDVAFVALLRQLRSQFETEYKISALLAQGGGTKEITEHFPKMTPFIIEKHIQQAQSYGPANLRKGLLKIDEVELNFKNSSGNADILNELLITHLTT